VDDGEDEGAGDVPVEDPLVLVLLCACLVAGAEPVVCLVSTVQSSAECVSNAYPETFVPFNNALSLAKATESSSTRLSCSLKANGLLGKVSCGSAIAILGNTVCGGSSGVDFAELVLLRSFLFSTAFGLHAPAALKFLSCCFSCDAAPYIAPWTVARNEIASSKLLQGR
jgi:hypothetical protein